MSDTIKVLGLAGSLRAKSFNRMLLRTAGELMPAGMALDIYDLAPLPMYNHDVYEKGFPPSVQDLRERIVAADALIFATPEYNYSMAPVLKNAIDWASRPPNQPFLGKPAAVMGASMGLYGASRVQAHMRQIGIAIDLRILNRPEVLVAQAQNKFDAEGRLTDETARDLLKQQMAAFADWIKLLLRR